MWSVRSMGDRVVPAFFGLIFALIAGGAQAQTATDGSDRGRVQVLQIKEGTATNTKEIAVKKPKSATAHAKKKAAHRNNLNQAKAATNEATTPAQDDTSKPAAEQTGTLGVGEHVVALASPPGGENDVGLSATNYVVAKEEPTSAPTIDNAPRANVDAERALASQMPGSQVPTGGSRLSQGIATLSGAMVAAAFGWFLVSLSRRRILLRADT